MTATMPTMPVSTELREDLRARLERERAFRVEQIAELDVRLAEGLRRDSVTFALRLAAMTALNETEAALVRMEVGTYGGCVHCGDAIALERLEVWPAAALCAGCHFNEENCRSRWGA